jgi:uncharacterized protein (DUF1330 family)
MAAYVFVDVNVTDPERFKGYQALAPDSVARYGGKYLARGGAVAMLEGEMHPHRVVILEFPSLEQARLWYASPEYAKAIAARKGAAVFRMLAVEGV